jgi:hypothetical protein
MSWEFGSSPAERPVAQWRSRVGFRDSSEATKKWVKPRVFGPLLYSILRSYL